MNPPVIKREEVEKKIADLVGKLSSEKCKELSTKIKELNILLGFFRDAGQTLQSKYLYGKKPQHSNNDVIISKNPKDGDTIYSGDALIEAMPTSLFHDRMERINAEKIDTLLQTTPKFSEVIEYLKDSLLLSRGISDNFGPTFSAKYYEYGQEKGQEGEITDKKEDGVTNCTVFYTYSWDENVGQLAGIFNTFKKVVTSTKEKCEERLKNLPTEVHDAEGDPITTVSVQCSGD